MTSKPRARMIGIAASIAAIPFLIPTAAGANATLDQTNGTPDKLAPGECAGYLWTNTTGIQLSARTPRYIIPGLVKPAGSIDVTEAITLDIRRSLEIDAAVAEETQAPEVVEKDAPAAEKFEKMRVEYWKGDRMLGATTYTPDLLDNMTYSWAITPLGRVDIFEDADRVELVHASQWMDTDKAPNAFYPLSVCFTWSPLVTQTSVAIDVACDKATLTMRNDGTAKANLQVNVNGTDYDYLVRSYGGSIDKTIDLTEDQWTEITVTDTDTHEVIWAKKWLTDCEAAPAVVVNEVTSTTVPTEVLGTQVSAAPAQVLAFTGSQATTNATIGGALLALGFGLVTLGRRRKVSDI